MKTALALILLCTTSVQGQILIYKMAFNRTVMGNGFTRKGPATGYVVVDAGTEAAAEFILDPRFPKEYSFRNKTVTVDTVNGGPGKSYMVFAEALVGTNTSSRYRFSSTAKGINVSLDVGLVGKRLVPRTMQFISRDVFRLGIEPFIEESAGTLRIDLSGTQSANSAGQTLDDVVATIRSNLAERGYKDNHP